MTGTLDASFSETVKTPVVVPESPSFRLQLHLKFVQIDAGLVCDAFQQCFPVASHTVSATLDGGHEWSSEPSCPAHGASA